MVFEMYPQDSCVICGRTRPTAFMGVIEGKYPMCPEHYNEAINTYGVDCKLSQLKNDIVDIKALRKIQTTLSNDITKYSIIHHIPRTTLRDKVITIHKKLIVNIGKNVDNITLLENKNIINHITNDLLPELLPYTIPKTELRSIRVNKSYSQEYHELLTGRKHYGRGDNLWLL